MFARRCGALDGYSGVMAEEDTLSQLDTAADQIAGMHDARIDRHELEDGSWVVSMEHDDWAVSGSGLSEAQALSDLIQNARAQGLAP